MKKKIINLFIGILFIAGLSLVIYPSFNNYWNQRHQTRAIAGYEEKVEDLTEKQYEKLWNDATLYNKNLRHTMYALNDNEKKIYNETLDVTGTGMMGYVEIPKINVSLPIYHGTDAEILQIAIGHIPGTSLPVGGESTHCVISGHRGLPSAQLFTDIDQLKTGDTFMLQILDQTLYYEVDQIKTVLPTEKDDLKIVEGQDYCTLMTCTPYGVNTHRLLVRGHRINKTNLRIRRDLVKTDPVILDIFWIALAIIIAFIWYLTSKKHKERWWQQLLWIKA